MREGAQVTGRLRLGTPIHIDAEGLEGEPVGLRPDWEQAAILL